PDSHRPRSMCPGGKHFNKKERTWQLSLFTFTDYASPAGPPKFMGNAGSFVLIAPLATSNRLMLSCKAPSSLLACSGVRTILDFTLALGTPGIIRIKSRTNSVFEWVMIARLL